MWAIRLVENNMINVCMHVCNVIVRIFQFHRYIEYACPPLTTTGTTQNEQTMVKISIITTHATNANENEARTDVPINSDILGTDCAQKR